MGLQEFLVEHSDEIMKEIDEYLTSEEKAKEQLTDRTVVEKTLFGKWLNDFTIHNPDDFFLEQEEIDNELESNIMSPIEFMLNTLEFFGLPKDYINGNGHHSDFEKRTADAKAKHGKKGKKSTKKMSAALKKL